MTTIFPDALKEAAKALEQARATYQGLSYLNANRPQTDDERIQAMIEYEQARLNLGKTSCAFNAEMEKYMEACRG